MIYAQTDDTHGKVVYPLHWIYAHGDLQKFLGYDNIDTDSADLADKHRFLSRNHGTFVVEEQAQNSLGKIKKVRIYLWRSGGTARGLAVWLGDKEGMADALDKFERLSPII